MEQDRTVKNQNQSFVVQKMEEDVGILKVEQDRAEVNQDEKTWGS